ncbi:hypothetical protein ACFVT5_19375 [Streptomyces sp. NPDC058001]|uniref:hypothetical protein n=1 Tax=Streptomyces sp. NPDC058001 TaxID=3346300 RepID=UPI0036E23B93
MADNDPRPQGTRRAIGAGPEMRMARDLIAAEYELREPSMSESLVGVLRDAWNRLMGRSAPTGGEASYGGGPEVGPPGRGGYAPGGQQQPAAEMRDPRTAAAQMTLMRLDRAVEGLSPRQYEAFEDAVLHVLRSDKRLDDAYRTAPDSMPIVKACVTNALHREDQRKRSRDGVAAREVKRPGKLEKHPRPQDPATNRQVTRTSGPGAPAGALPADRQSLVGTEGMKSIQDSSFGPAAQHRRTRSGTPQPVRNPSAQARSGPTR